MDLNISLLKRNVESYSEVKQIGNTDIFVVKYKPTDDTFALRKTNLKEYRDLEIFENETNLTNRLKHKNLLTFISSFIAKSQLWTIMPFAEFRSMADLSKPFGLREEAVSLVIKDVLQAVKYLHNNCIIHHSIRGSHILLFGSPETEFRCILSGLKYSINTIRNGRIVTPVFDYPIGAELNLNWLATEVLEQNLYGYETKADIYSIGITCCELSNGAIPFGEMEAADVLLNKVNGEIPEPLDCNSDLGMTDIQLSEMNEHQKLVYNACLQKRFSPDFKRFTSEACLHPEPHKRLNALQLLDHSFIKRYEHLDKTKVIMESIRINQLPEEIRKLV